MNILNLSTLYLN